MTEWKKARKMLPRVAVQSWMKVHFGKAVQTARSGENDYKHNFQTFSNN